MKVPPQETTHADRERWLFWGFMAILTFAIIAIAIPTLWKAPVIRWVENQGGTVYTRAGWFTKLLPHQLRSRLDQDLGGDRWRAPVDRIYSVYLETDLRTGDLDRLHRFRELKNLWLKGPGVTDSYLASLPNFQHLEILHLNNTRISAAGLIHLKSLPRLRYLNLENNVLGDESLVHLADLSGLQHLNIGETKITDEGLAPLAGLSGLEVLFLSGTKITDDGMKQFESFPSLRRLGVWGTGVSDASVARLEAALPGIWIQR